MRKLLNESALESLPNQQSEQAIINKKIQSIQREAIPLRTVMKKTLMYLYCKGVIPKPITQNVYDILKLKDL